MEAKKVIENIELIKRLDLLNQLLLTSGSPRYLNGFLARMESVGIAYPMEPLNSAHVQYIQIVKDEIIKVTSELESI